MECTLAPGADDATPLGFGDEAGDSEVRSCRQSLLGKRSKPLTLFDAVSGNRRQLRRIRGEGGGGDEAGEREEVGAQNGAGLETF